MAYKHWGQQTIEIVADSGENATRSSLGESDNSGSDRFIQTAKSNDSANGFYLNYYDSYDFNAQFPDRGRLISADEHREKFSISASAGRLATSLYANVKLNGIVSTPNRLMCAQYYFVGVNREGYIPFNRKLHSICIYNRALSSEEIIHNYAIDKERFHL